MFAVNKEQNKFESTMINNSYVFYKTILIRCPNNTEQTILMKSNTSDSIPFQFSLLFHEYNGGGTGCDNHIVK